MNRIFTEEGYQKQFDKSGYAIIPFLDYEQVRKLSDKYNALIEQHPFETPVHSTTDTNNKEVIVAVDRFIKDVCGPSFNRFFGKSNIFLSNFLVKEGGADSAIPPHADWAFVDETKFSSASIWCPLTDVDETNGCLYVLEGSHNFLPTMRASPDTPNIYNDVMGIVEKHMKPLPLKAGEAVVYNHALIHSSPPNLSSSRRITLAIGVIPDGAPLCFFYYESGSGKRSISQYSVDTDWFYDYKKHMRPVNAKFEKRFQFEFKQITEAELYGFINTFNGIELKPGLSIRSKFIEKLLTPFK